MIVGYKSQQRRLPTLTVAAGGRLCDGNTIQSSCNASLRIFIPGICYETIYEYFHTFAVTHWLLCYITHGGTHALDLSA